MSENLTHSCRGKCSGWKEKYTVDYNITAFKDQNGEISVTDSISEQIIKIGKIKYEFIEQLMFESMTTETLEMMLIRCLDALIQKPNEN